MADTAESPTRIPIRSASPEEIRAKSKRRSLLLQPGTLVAAHRQASGNGTAPNTVARQRPMTMFSPDMSTLAGLAAQFGGIEEGGDMASNSDALARLEGRSTKTPTGSTTSRPNTIPSSAASTTAKSALSRSQSLRKPTSAAESTRPLPTAPNRTSTLRSSRPLSTLVESTTSRSFRPDSAISNSSSESHPPPAQSRLKAPSTAASAPGLRRAATTSARNGAAHPRPLSGLPAPSTSQSQYAPKLDASTQQRPGFNTFQQHYSPLKNPRPKPLSSSLIHAAPPEPISASPSSGLEAQILQTQLLQLSILHRDASGTERAWEDSARRNLEKRFEKVVSLAGEVQGLERQSIKERNLIALRDWGAGDGGGGGGGNAAADAAFAENAQTLAAVIRDATVLAEEGGRIHGVLSQFETWISGVETIWASRANSPSNTGGSGFMEDLGEDWRNEVATLIRRLGSLERGLSSLPTAKEGSSLAHVLRVFEELVEGMAGELRCVQVVERDVVGGERKWVDMALDGCGFGMGMEIG